jgi:hypothetical protein
MKLRRKRNPKKKPKERKTIHSEHDVNRRSNGTFKTPPPWAWKPGQSGNPNGRPKQTTLSAAYKAALSKPFPDGSGRTFAEVIAESMLFESIAGTQKVQAAKEVRTATEGSTVTVSTDWRKIVEELGVDPADVLTEVESTIENELNKLRPDEN